MQELGSTIEETMGEVDDITLKRKYEEIKILGINSEKYITLKWNNMWFIDPHHYQDLLRI